MEYKVTLSLNTELYERLPDGIRYKGSVFANNEVVPSYGVLLQLLDMAIAEVKGSQPNFKRGDTKDGNDTADSGPKV